ncbi:MAG: orotidine-5'-phosphate decarboxylase [archaeon]
MDKKMTYEQRAKHAKNPAAKKLFGLMATKKTNLCLAADETSTETLLKLINDLGSEIAVLKMHIDIVTDFTPDFTKKLVELSKKHNFMIFEDRKFADIGNTVKLQYSKGIYNIADWANLVTVHTVPGHGVIEGLREVMKEKEKDGIERGILILSQMSSDGTLATADYTKKSVDMSNANKDSIAGHIGAGSDPKELKKLVDIADNGQVIFTPGVKLGSKKDSLGQKYTTPDEAVKAGSDCIVVGRGLYQSENPKATAKIYRDIAWEAYLKRTQG